MINELIKNKDAGVHSEFISELLTKMTAYALEHLRYEEAWLEEIGYPELEEHKAQHRDYRLTVAKFCIVTSSGTMEVTPALLDYLSKWWTSHILTEDQKYREFFCQKAANRQRTSLH
jgi:hemerythrin